MSNRTNNLTPKQLHFCRAVVSGQTLSDSYREAYSAGNMETAYDGIMADLRELVTLAPAPSAEDSGSTAALAENEDRDDGSDQFPDDWPAPSSEFAVADSDVEAIRQAAGADDNEQGDRIRELMRTIVHKAKRHKRG